MEHWQFLIQKQGDAPKQNPPRGDGSWRLLESPNVEITEGRYRVVACSNLGNVDVEVQITHTSTLEVPPKRRIQVRSRRTNSEGLIPVIPYTYLKPGIWELRCSGKLMSDRGKRWQHSIQLQVLPKVAANEVGRGNNEELSVLTAELSQQEAIIEQPISPVWLKGETVEQILQNLIELALPASELLPEDDKTVEDSPADTEAAPLAVKLEEEIYIARWGETLTINGRVEQKEATLDLSQTSNYERVYGGEIRIELHSPQDSEIIRRVRQSLPEKFIPFPIRCSIEIPADCESKLILGEISLYGVLTIGSQAVLLAKESFTITDVRELLTTSTVFTKSEPLATCEAQKLSVPLDLKLFNLVKTPNKVRSLALHPSPKKSLPPKLNRQSLRKSAAISPQLPRFAQHQNQIMSPAVSEPPLNLENSDTNSTATAVSYVISKGTAFPYLKRLKTSQDEIEVIKRYPPEMFDFPAPVDSQQHTSEMDHEYAALSVAEDAESQDASFVQLVSPSSSELITTSSPHISPLIRKWMHTQGYSLPEPINLQNQDDYTYIVPRQEQVYEKLDTHTPGNDDTDNPQDTKIEEQIATHTPSLPPSLPPSPRHQEISSTWLVQEIVVDDTSNEAEADTFKNQASKQKEASVSNVLFYLPLGKESTEALPVPQLHLPQGELVCGKSVRVRVQLAQVCPEVAVKLWIEDCQTRWLLEEPLWLTNLLPNSSGGLEETTHIIVPFGCLEIRLEAIAVNTVTQQESDKITIQRAVIPPDLPSLQLDELLDF
ncbi:hypothetical protein SD81_008720 [Tolypothrix campylonemoides VB511288]|nr:hypothetical protein SD81_008720 [Tolypothrix campylonemoides VB511288]